MAPVDKRPPLVRGWSGKVVLPNYQLAEEETKALICNISKSGLVQISRELTENEDLSALDLRHHYFLAPEGATLAKGLAQNLGLMSLNLQNNDLGDEGVIYIAQALQQQSPSLLQDLNLCSNSIGDAGCKELGNWLIESGSAKELHLKNNRIGADGAKCIGEGMGKNRSLKVLNISQNDLQDDGAVAIAEGILQGSPLKDLDMGTNSIGNQGANRLGEALSKNGPMQRVILRVNRIREQGWRRFLEGVVHNTKLRELDFSSNILEDNIIDWMIPYVTNTKTLSKFHVNDNFLTDNFGRQILKALERNESLPLVSFNVDQNRFTEFVKGQIDLLIRTNANEIMKKEKEKRKTTKGGRKTTRIPSKS